MSIRHYIGIILLLFSFVYLQAQERYVLKGKIVDFLTVQPLENACVHNMSSGLMVFSDAQGNYALMVRLNDTIAISRVGFNVEVLVVSDSVINNRGHFFIRLLMKSIMLKNFTVYAMKPYPLFVKDLAKKTAYDKVEVPGVTLSEEEKSQSVPHSDRGNLLANTPLAHPISFLYEKFSRKARLQRTYKELVSNQDEVMRMAEKYNAEVVKRITRLSGSEVDEFMLFCGFSYYTIAMSTDVEIEQMIAKKYMEYKQYKSANQ
ncbi:MAG: hypothetical protein J5701_08500 [Bacteroidales bacterium]|nr:hypothetical protein [Bacteroidales bacterium]